MDLDVDYKVEDAILPGFRFHPTDEELVGFYLKRKVQHRSFSIELIKQVDIYKYDPWDLPKLSIAGEKECYFFCPRDRKYRNSARPNRVTGGGFWKATGTDRPIYSSDGSKCIGLKKSLVFYRGRAARGIKTDWMMHEFRLPSPPATANVTHDAWALCRIFKKTNSMPQRSHHLLTTQFNPPHHMNTTSFSPQPSSYPLVFAPLETSATATTSTVTTNSAVDTFLNQQASDSFSFDGPHEQFNDFLIEFPFSMPFHLPWDSQDMSSGCMF